jgi:hypothetical protein
MAVYSRLFRQFAAALAFTVSGAVYAHSPEPAPKPKHPPILHGAKERIAPLLPYKNIFAKIAGDTNHILIIAREDLLSDEESRTQDLAQIIDPGLSLKPDTDIIQKRLEHIFSVYEKIPSYLKDLFLTSDHQEKTEQFEKSARYSASALVYQHENNEKICIINVPDRRENSVGLLSNLMGLPSELLERRNFSFNNEAMQTFIMFHEARHCAFPHNHSDSLESKLSKLSTETDADREALIGMKYIYGAKSKKWTDMAQAIHYARIIGAVRGARNLERSELQFLTHSSYIYGEGKDQDYYKDVMMAPSLLNTAVHKTLGILTAREEFLSERYSDFFLKYTQERPTILRDAKSRVSFVQKNPALFGEYMASGYPLLEYATIRAIATHMQKQEKEEQLEAQKWKARRAVSHGLIGSAIGRPLSLREIRPKVPGEKFLRQTIDDYIAGFEYFVPSAKNNPKVASHIALTLDLFDKRPGLVHAGIEAVLQRKAELGKDRSDEALFKALEKPQIPPAPPLFLPKL